MEDLLSNKLSMTPEQKYRYMAENLKNGLLDKFERLYKELDDVKNKWALSNNNKTLSTTTINNLIEENEKLRNEIEDKIIEE